MINQQITKSNENPLINVISEILQGFSLIQWKGEPLFLKHHCMEQHALISLNIERKQNEIESRGVPNEETAIAEAIERGDWTQKEEDSISESLDRMDALNKAAEHMMVLKQKEAQYQMVEDIRDSIREKQVARSVFTMRTAENLAMDSCYNDFLSEVIFVDREMTKLKEDEEELEIEDFMGLRIEQKNIYNRFNDTQIAKAVLSDFFKPLLSYADDPNKLFGKPIVELSIFQLKLLSYANMFFNIFQNTSGIPDFIKKDPEAIIDFVNSQHEEDYVMERRGKPEPETGGKVYFGANKEDLEKLRKSGDRIVDLSEEVKKAGGSLDMKAMMDLSGVEERK